MSKKVIVVVGPEGTGSKLCAKAIAASVGVCKFEEWNGFVWAPNGTADPVFINEHAVLHRSVPSGDQHYILDASSLINKHENIFFVFTTRDKNISKISRGYTKEEHQKWISENKRLIRVVQEHQVPYAFFSYESFMLYSDLYLKELYCFLDIDKNFVPDIIDGNEKYLKET